MKLVYFAWVRERIGVADETIDLPAGVDSVADLLGWLKGRGPQYESALEEPSAIRVAIDQNHVEFDAPLRNATEVALFPPMTGG